MAPGGRSALPLFSFARRYPPGSRRVLTAGLHCAALGAEGPHTPSAPRSLALCTCWTIDDHCPRTLSAREAAPLLRSRGPAWSPSVGGTGAEHTCAEGAEAVASSSLLSVLNTQSLVLLETGSLDIQPRSPVAVPMKWNTASTER